MSISWVETFKFNASTEQQCKHDVRHTCPHFPSIMVTEGKQPCVSHYNNIQWSHRLSVHFPTHFDCACKEHWIAKAPHTPLALPTPIAISLQKQKRSREFVCFCGRFPIVVFFVLDNNCILHTRRSHCVGIWKHSGRARGVICTIN